MMSRMWLSLCVGLGTLLLVGCGSVADGGDTTTPTARRVATSTTTPLPTSTTSLSPAGAPTLPGKQFPPAIIPPPFNLSDYENGQEITALLAEVGEERVWPGELGNDASPLPLSEARERVIEFLSDSRVFSVGSEIFSVTDYCDNNTTIARYPFGTQWRGFARGIYNEGKVSIWNIEHGEFTEWNSPYLTGPISSFVVTSYLSRGIDAAGFSKLGPADSDGIVNFGFPASEFRVFDNPDCADPQTVGDYSAAAWTLLGMGEEVEFPAGLRLSDPPTDGKTLVETWDAIFQNIATFDNYNGWPVLYFCGDHRGIELSEDSPVLGEQFTWSIRDGSDVVPNAIWLIYDYDNPNVGTRQQLIYIPAQDDPLRTVVPVELIDCSIEAGSQYVDQISERLDWLDERAEDPLF